MFCKVENPGQFWINYSSRTKSLDEMVDRINEELAHMPIHSNKIVPNGLCLAPYQGRYYRAKILLVVPRPIDDSLVSSCFNVFVTKILDSEKVDNMYLLNIIGVLY